MKIKEIELVESHLLLYIYSCVSCMKKEVLLKSCDDYYAINDVKEAHDILKVRLGLCDLKSGASSKTDLLNGLINSLQHAGTPEEMGIQFYTTDLRRLPPTSFGGVGPSTLMGSVSALESSFRSKLAEHDSAIRDLKAQFQKLFLLVNAELRQTPTLGRVELLEQQAKTVETESREKLVTVNAEFQSLVDSRGEEIMCTNKVSLSPRAKVGRGYFFNSTLSLPSKALSPLAFESINERNSCTISSSISYRDHQSSVLSTSSPSSCDSGDVDRPPPGTLMERANLNLTKPTNTRADRLTKVSKQRKSSNIKNASTLPAGLERPAAFGNSLFFLPRFSADWMNEKYFDEKDVSTLRERVESFSSDVSGDKGDTYFRQKYGRSVSHQPHSINKLAEAANLGMKRLRRNWSVTKNEVRTGLSKIKKKSTFSGVEAKSTEDILSEMSSSQSEKAKWSFRHFRRKSTSSILPSSLSLSNEEKDKATFYLTLTIASDRQEAEDGLLNTSPKSSDRRLCSNLERRKSNTPSISSVATTTSCDTSVSSRSRPLSMPGTSLFRNTSSGSTSGALLRPTTAPPAPPVEFFDHDVYIPHLTDSFLNSGRKSLSYRLSYAEDEEYQREISKEQLACRLNQILSAGPPPPPGRRILKYSECSSSESSPVPLLLPCEDKSPPLNVAPHSKYSSPPQFPQLPLPRRGNSSLSLSSEITNSIKSNVPQARLSVASSSSSHGYIRACDIASSPPPLPARPTSIAGSGNSLSLARLSNLSQSHPNISAPIMISGTSDIDNRSYLDLTCDPNVEDEPPYMSSHFADEPLYQFYTAKVERAALYQGDSSEDDYEVINDGGLSARVEPLSRPTAMELVTPTDGRRTLWCELPEVINSGILSKISSQERKVQEAIFEVVTSEASYLKSLEVLVHHFMNCEEISRTDDPVITSRDRNVLFSDIIQVKKCSELFLADLEKRWQESFMISRITDIIHQHSTSSFNCYIKYCSNQIYQDRKLRHLKVNNPRFVEVLNRLESAPICQSLAMHSFLMLPMQRITRLPLLVDAIFNRLEYGSSQWQECKTALASLQKIVSECNEGARKMERMEEMLIISHQLDFREVKAIPLISASRWLVKKGELTRLTWKEGDNKLTFGRKISKHSLYFFLFTDLLVVTKKKSEDQHMVLDYCPRNMVQVLELESADKFPGRLLDGHKNLIIMTMLQNHETKTVEMVLSCPLESDRTRWMEGVTPRISENPDERIYEEWDCPQVQAVHTYVSTQPDELTLEISDVFNVLKKTSDGWYQGERLRDGSRGWFPGNHTVEIASAHVRARNLRQRYRLLAISGSIVDELKKEKEKFEKEEKKKERRRTITIKEVL